MKKVTIEIYIQGIPFNFNKELINAYAQMTGDEINVPGFGNVILANDFKLTTQLSIEEGLKKYTKEEIEDIISASLTEELKFQWGDNWNAK